MNLNLMDPKLIVLAAVVVILIIAVLAWLYVRKRRSTTADLRQEIWARVRSGGAEAWVRTKSRSEISGSREAGGKAQHSRS